VIFGVESRSRHARFITKDSSDPFARELPSGVIAPLGEIAFGVISG
jgi:hypothetical protein